MSLDALAPAADTAWMNPHAELIFHEIAYGSNAYRAECGLRDEVLRRPLGLSLYDEDLRAEATHLHFGLFEADVLSACIIAEPVSAREVKLRQMAVSPESQGRGYGRRLLESLEAELVTRGYVTAFLHARASAVGFYARSGFEEAGHAFLEVGIPHRKMSKRLNLEGHED